MKTRKLLSFATVALVVLLIGAGMALAQGSGPAVEWWVVAGGGAPSSGGNVTLNDTLGQPVVGDASGGSVTLHAGYWPCNTPAAVGDVVAAKLNSTDVRLTWSGTGVFDVWRGTSPYFTPGDAGSERIGAGMTSPFTAAGVLGDPATNYTFLVLAQNACGSSDPSNRTAEFDFSLTPGSP
jgi:hypothetical protein